MDVRRGLGRFQQAAASVWLRAGRRARGADWAAVLFELIMIVTGILIAFQLDRWAEGWRRASERDLYLERLIEESAGNVATLEASVRNFAADTAELRGLIEGLGDPQARRRIPAGTGCTMLRLPAVRLQTAAMAEHADAAALDLLHDTELRRLIHRASGIDAYGVGQLEYFRSFFLHYFEQLDSHFTYRLQSDGNVACQLSLDEIAADPEALSTLTAVYADRVNFIGLRERQLAEHRAVHDRACVLSGRCASRASANARPRNR